MDREPAVEDRSVVVIGICGRVIGFDVATGARKFEHPIADAGGVEILIHADRIYAATAATLCCYHYPSGEKIGMTKLPAFGAPTMLIVDDRLFVGTGGEISCLNLDGQPLWHDPLRLMGNRSVCIAVPGQTRHADHER